MTKALSPDEKLEVIRRAWPLWVAVIAKAVVDRYGDEGRSLIMDCLRQQAIVQGRKVFVERRGIRPDVQGFVQEVATPQMGIMGHEFEIVELSESRCVMHVTRCPLAERWKLIGAPEDMCEIWDSYNLGFRQVINPDIIHYHIKSIYKGDPFCKTVFETPK